MLHIAARDLGLRKKECVQPLDRWDEAARIRILVKHSVVRGRRYVGRVNVVGMQEKEEWLVFVGVEPTQRARKYFCKTASFLVVRLESTIESKRSVQIAAVDETRRP